MTTKREILDAAKKQDVSSLRLQFTDILASTRMSRCPRAIRKGLEGDIM